MANGYIDEMDDVVRSEALGRIETVPVGVVVDRRKGVTRWAEWSWRPVSVFVGGAQADTWSEIRAGDGWTSFYAGSFTLELHRADAEAYKRNLASPMPSVYVVLAPAKGAVPWRLHSVSASPYEGEAYMVGQENLVEAVPMPADLRELVAAFADQHFAPTEFKKRQRTMTAALEEAKFGKQPIFDRERRSGGGGDNG